MACVEFRSLPFDPATKYVDIGMFGQEEFGSVYLIEDEKVALIESGTSWDVHRILGALKRFDRRPAEVDYIIVSHVHLDHAGGAGFLLKEMRKARVLVHEKGYKHLLDPTRLLTSASNALQDMANEFGTMIPIRSDRLQAVKEGDKLELGGRELIFLHSPGHAPHQMTVHDTRNNCLYVGDAAGLYFPEDSLLLPITPPPSFDLKENLLSMQRFLELKPKALLFSHFGPHERPEEAIRTQLQLYPEWSDYVGRNRLSKDEESMVEHLYSRHCSDASHYDHEFLRRRIRNSVNGLVTYHQRLEDASKVH